MNARSCAGQETLSAAISSRLSLGDEEERRAYLPMVTREYLSPLVGSGVLCGLAAVVGDGPVEGMCKAVRVYLPVVLR